MKSIFKKAIYDVVFPQGIRVGDGKSSHDSMSTKSFSKAQEWLAKYNGAYIEKRSRWFWDKSDNSIKSYTFEMYPALTREEESLLWKGWIERPQPEFSEQDWNLLGQERYD